MDTNISTAPRIGKVTKVTIDVPARMYEEFKNKTREDGYSIQQALHLLIQHYSNNTLTIDWN